MKFSFDNTQAAQEGKSLTTPGTIAVFDIEEVTFGEKNDKEFFQIQFSRAEDTFSEWFYLTEKAAERFVYFFQKVTDSEGNLPNSEDAIIAALKGKQVALRVGGNVNPQNGKGGPRLPYAAFARKPALLQELVDRGFSGSESEAINAALAAIRGSNGTSETPPEAVSDTDSF